VHPLLTAALPLACGSPCPDLTSSQQVVLDRAGARLERYHQETNPAKRAALLRGLAPSRDPRVAVALGEALADRSLAVRVAATYGLLNHHLPAPVEGGTEQHMKAAARWWKANQDRLGRHAVGPEALAEVLGRIDCLLSDSTENFERLAPGLSEESRAGLAAKVVQIRSRVDWLAGLLAAGAA
jgi:hypothetical protein